MADDPMLGLWEMMTVLDALCAATAIIAVGGSPDPKRYAAAFREYAERAVDQRARNPTLVREGEGQASAQRVRHMLEHRLTVMEQAATSSD